MADIASYPDLMEDRHQWLLYAKVSRQHKHTVDVISFEHTSHINFKPPSVPFEMVFFLMTPMTSGPN